MPTINTQKENEAWKEIARHGSKQDIIEQIWLVSEDLDEIRSMFIQYGIDLKHTDIIQRLGLDIKQLDSIERKINSL